MARRRGASQSRTTSRRTEQSSAKKSLLDDNLDSDAESRRQEEDERLFEGPTLTYEEDGLTVTASPLGSIEARVDLIDNDNLEVELVVGIDASPVDFGVEYDVETGEVTASGEVGLPGDMLGVSGGLTIDTETGEIIGISGGLEVGGLAVELEQSLDGCKTTMTVTYFGIGVSTTVNNCEDEEEDEEDEDDGGNDDNGGPIPDPIDLDPDLYPPNTMILAVVDWRLSWFSIQRETIDYVRTEWREDSHYLKKGYITRVGDNPADWEYSSTFSAGEQYDGEGPGGFKGGWFDADGGSYLFPFYYGTYGSFLGYATRTWYDWKSLSFYSSYRKYGAYMRPDLEPYPYDDSFAQGWDRFVITRAIGPDGTRNTGIGVAYSRYATERLMVGVSFYTFPLTESTPTPRPRRRRPPPPPPRRRGTTDDCCRESLALIRKIANVVGATEEEE